MDHNEVSTTNPNAAIKPTKKGISGSTLKLIAIITMLIDHTAATILDKTLIARGAYQLDPGDPGAALNFMADNGLIYFGNIAMRLIGRIAFPIFCFLLIEGFLHTRNKWKYAVRLGAFALISEIPFDLALMGKILEFSYQNVFFTLLIGLLVMMGFQAVKDRLGDKKWLPALAVGGVVVMGAAVALAYSNFVILVKSIVIQVQNVTSNTRSNASAVPQQSLLIPVIIFIFIGLIVYFIMCKKSSVQKASIRFANLLVLAIGMAVSELLSTDYSALGILTIAVMYGLRNNRVKSMLGGCITLTVLNFAEFTAFINLLFVKMYNGTRGLSLKYVFYIFYPAHLLILYIICYLMGIA